MTANLVDLYVFFLKYLATDCKRIVLQVFLSDDGASCEVHYSASKAAVIGFTKALSKEVGPSGITVNCIAPGFIDTKMNAHLTEDDVQEIVDCTPMMRKGTGDDVAYLCEFLASEKAGFITGQVISVDGGYAV